MKGRARLATLAIAAVVANAIAPGFAQTTVANTGIANVDPRYLAFVHSHPCGLPKGDESTPAPNAADYAATYASARALGHGNLPRTRDLGRMQMLILSPPGDTSASPAPGASDPSPSPVAAANDVSQSPESSPNATASPLPTPSPSPSPTLIPIPRVPPGGGAAGQLVPPTPQPTGSVTPSPDPLPSASASGAAATGPVLLQRTTGTPAPFTPKGATPGPSSSPNATPTATGASPIPTLGPNSIVTIADHLDGSTDLGQPSDLTGNVHVFYTEGQIVGDRAHYDGMHTIVVSGHTYLLNRAQDSILYADKISFDTTTRRATLLNGSGETIEGVQRGELHYAAQTLNARTSGVSHGDRASFTTCENGHAGYHVEARTIDVTPGDKLVARKAVLFLGPTAILYLPLLVIPLVQNAIRQRDTTFLPLIGYDQLDGFFIKTRLGFGPSDQYYGYYRVEYFTKRGLGLGYVAYIGAKDVHRYTTIDAYTIKDHVLDQRTTNVNIQDTETFSRRLRAQFGFNYVGDFGTGISLPASENITGSIIHQGNVSTENLTFSRYLQGPLSDNLNIGLLDSISLGPAIQQQFNFAYARFNSSLASNDTFHIQSNTHVFTKAADYNLTYDKTDYSSNPFGYDRLPELQVLPHINYGNLRFGPQLQFTLGEYAEQQNHFSTSRFQGQLNDSVYLKVFGNSDFSANYNLTQDYYGTGDEKAFDQQNAALTTPIGNHIVNAITYNEQHPIGPTDVPFQLFDHLSNGAHSAQDVLRFYNKDIYSFSISDGTSFNRQAQSLTYQLNVRPSLKSYLVIGGYYQPGPGNGFNTTNVQAITPFGKDTILEFSTNIDWKNHNRLENKNIYLSKTVDECYNLLASYNQDLKQFSLNVVILAFPGQSAGFGFGGQTTPIIPQNFAL